MTSVPGPPVQVATQFYLLTAQSTVAEGSVRPEVFGGTARLWQQPSRLASLESGDPAGQESRNLLGEEVLMP